nr:MAG: nonstructural protein [Scaphoideus titanus reo-like virus 1]
MFFDIVGRMVLPAAIRSSRKSADKTKDKELKHREEEVKNKESVDPSNTKFATPPNLISQGIISTETISYQKLENNLAHGQFPPENCQPLQQREKRGYRGSTPQSDGAPSHTIEGVAISVQDSRQSNVRDDLNTGRRDELILERGPTSDVISKLSPFNRLHLYQYSELIELNPLTVLKEVTEHVDLMQQGFSLQCLLTNLATYNTMRMSYSDKTIKSWSLTSVILRNYLSLVGCLILHKISSAVGDDDKKTIIDELQSANITVEESCVHFSFKSIVNDDIKTTTIMTRPGSLPDASDDTMHGICWF